MHRQAANKKIPTLLFGRLFGNTFRAKHAPPRRRAFAAARLASPWMYYPASCSGMIPRININKCSA